MNLIWDHIETLERKEGKQKEGKRREEDSF